MDTAAPLYLASQSRMRRQLLETAKIPFTVINQSADETVFDWNKPYEEIVLEIARSKMAHALIPLPSKQPAIEAFNDNELSHQPVLAHDNQPFCYVITADTMCIDKDGKMHGKPKDEAEASEMLKLWRYGCTVITGFCLDRKSQTNSQKSLTENTNANIDNTWITDKRIEGAVSTYIDFCVPDEWISDYLKETPSLTVAGGMAIEDYGFQFVKTINGSYSNIIGLPLFEVREALMKLGFFSDCSIDR